MTWSNGTPSLICELCGQENHHEDVVWYRDELAICQDADACKKRQEVNAWVIANEERKKHPHDRKRFQTWRAD